MAHFIEEEEGRQLSARDPVSLFLPDVPDLRYLTFRPGQGERDYAAIFAIFYFILIRPQQRQRKQHELTIQNLKKGDRVVAAGGVIGDVVHIKALGADDKPTAEDEVTIRSGESRLIVERGRIARIVTSAASASNSAA